MMVLAGAALSAGCQQPAGLIVRVNGKDGSPASTFTAKLDGKEICTGSPCQVEGIVASTHVLDVEAPGYQMPNNQEVTLKSGTLTVVELTLRKN